VDDIRVELSAGGTRRTITLDRPEKRNALTREMFDVLIDAFSADPPPERRVTVLRAEGSVFCAGVDLGQRTDNETGEGRTPLERLCAAVWKHPQPVVAVVQGSAIGGGAMVALHCDFVVADQDATFANGAVQLGLTPVWNVTRRIQEVVGAALARELLLGGDGVSASRLAHAHVIARAVPAGELDDAVERVVARLAANAPLSLRAVKATFAADVWAEGGHERVTQLIERVQGSADAMEGMLARKERRTPAYRGA
jgi:enoyl-CoA hydratase/carnithine racemase